MTPSAGLRVMTDTIVVPSVIDLVMAAARFVAVLATVLPYVAEEADVLFPTATVAMGHADEVRKNVLEDLVVVVIRIILLVVRGRHDDGFVRHRVGRRTTFGPNPIFNFLCPPVAALA